MSGSLEETSVEKPASDIYSGFSFFRTAEGHDAGGQNTLAMLSLAAMGDALIGLQVTVPFPCRRIPLPGMTLPLPHALMPCSQRRYNYDPRSFDAIRLPWL